MPYIYDEREKGYRLLCESCGTQSPIISSEERAAQGPEWWCSAEDCERHHLGVQKERLKVGLIERGLGLERAEAEVKKLRWDLMPDREQILPG